MDPDETLRQIRAYAKQMAVDVNPAIFRQHAIDMAEAFDDLDEWLKNGGFPPADWRK